MWGINGYQNITTQHVRDSWRETGLWPMDHGFSEKLRRRFDTLKERGEFEHQKLSHAGPCLSVRTLQTRTSDRNTLARLAEIVDKSRCNRVYGPSIAIQEMKIALDDQHTVNDILMESTSAPTSHKNILEAPKKNVVLPCGVPAHNLTHGDVMALREKQLKDKEKENTAKELRKAEREQKRSVKASMKQAKHVSKSTEYTKKRPREPEVKNDASADVILALLALARQT